MTTTPAQLASFTYRAQSRDGQPISGTLDARDVDDLNRQLHSMGLRATEIEPQPRPARARALRGEDFIAFNQQLAHLTGAGMPVEHGLRLIAQDMRRGSLAAAANNLASELERGTPLPEALAKYESKFPPLYAKLVEAGIKSNNLPAMLHNLGRHAEMVARLRAAMWRAAAYPLAIFIGVLVVLLVIGTFILPQLAEMYATMKVPTFPMWGTQNAGPRAQPGLPLVTRVLLAIAPAVPWIIGTTLALVLGSSIIWAVLRLAKMDRALVDLAASLPLIGPVIRKNLLARWLDAMRIAVSAGLDLPAAIALAGEAVGSPALLRDGRAMISAIESGKPIDSVTQLKFLPASIPAAIGLASTSSDLPIALDTLAQMQQQQAEIRLTILPALLTPLLLALVAGLIIFVLAGLLLPLFRMLTWLTGGGL
jgi:type II secretory pathway component PulF